MTSDSSRHRLSLTGAAASGAADVEADDAFAVRRVLAGDVDAFELLVRRHQDELYRYARGMRIEHDTACDLVQETFIRAFDTLAACRDPARFRFWIFRILRNRCLDWLKNIRRRHVAIDEVPLETELRSPSLAAQGVELREAIGHALDHLPDELREAFLMKHFDGRSYREMARLTGASVSALKMRVHRARETLRDDLLASGLRPAV